MRCVLIALLVTSVCLAGGVSGVLAGGNPEVSLGFHITPMGDDVSCAEPPPLGDGTTTEVCPEPETELLVWLFACNATDSSGVAGIEFGIDYDGQDGSGIEVLDFVNCTDFQVPAGDWPAAGSGSRMAWSYSENCQNTGMNGPNSVIAVAGVFHVLYHSPDRLRFVSYPAENGGIRVGGCDRGIDDIRGPLGVAGFCKPGFNGCVAQTAVRERGEFTPAFRLSRAFPNPFRTSTVTEFTLPAAGPARVQVHDVAGRRITTLLDEPRADAGPHQVVWNGRDEQGREVAPGIYFLHVVTRDHTATRKVVRIP
jgi:hypothetical protein